MSLKTIDKLCFHFLIILLAKSYYISVIILISLIYSLISSKIFDSKQEINYLSELSEFKDALDKGESHLHAYNRIFKFDYPSYFIHPNDDRFSYKIFIRQFNLYEKKILLDEELRASLSIVNFRMMLMKYIPIILMYILSSLITENSSEIVRGVLIVAFIASYYYSERIMI